MSRPDIDPVASGCSTLGKLPLSLERHLHPGKVVSASGASFKDEHGASWLDFDMALGSVVWGYGRAAFGDALRDAWLSCCAASVPTLAEHAAAEQLLDRLPRYDQVRFFKTGSDVCSAAIRLCRATTGRDFIATDGYHGWHDWSVARAYSDDSRTLGVLTAVREAVVPLEPEAGAEPALQRLGDAPSVAGVMLRPEAWRPGELARLVNTCRHDAIPIIFDEVTSHFKYGRAGVAGTIDLWPDLLCISKGLANGLPLAALLGPQAIMSQAGSAKISTTYATEGTAFAAMMVGERLLADSPEWPSWRGLLGETVTRLIDLVRSLRLDAELQFVVHPGFFSIQRRNVPFKPDPFRLHVAAVLAAKGIFSRGWFHGSDVHTAADFTALEDALAKALHGWHAR
jgi:glutamate-1-semialdehyde 2,1-aminomutase